VNNHNGISWWPRQIKLTYQIKNTPPRNLIIITFCIRTTPNMSFYKISVHVESNENKMKGLPLQSVVGTDRKPWHLHVKIFDLKHMEQIHTMVLHALSNKLLDYLLILDLTNKAMPPNIIRNGVYSCFTPLNSQLPTKTGHIIRICQIMNIIQLIYNPKCHKNIHKIVMWCNTKN